MRHTKRPKGSAVFHFRYTVPADLRGRLGQRELSYSLQTGYRREAASKVARLVCAVERTFTTLRRAAMGELSTQQIRALVDAYLREVLAENEHDRATGGVIPEETRECEAVDFAHALDALKDDLRSNRFDFITQVVDRLLTERNLKLDRNSDAYRALCREMLKGHVQLLDVELARNAGDYSKELPAVPVAPSASAAETGASPPMSEVFTAYVSEYTRGGSWTRKTKDENAAIFALLVEVVGDLPIRSVDHANMRAFKDTLARLPPNMRKVPRYRGKSIAEILEMDQVAPMSVSNVNKHITRVASFFKWAVKNGYMDKNPAEGMTLKKSKRADQERQAFTDDDLGRLFDSADYRDGHEKPYQHWLPYLGLFTGARIEELCQLDLDDVREVDGILCLDINARGTDKRLKSKASERIVPVHPALLELGFAEYIAQLRAEGHSRVFPELKRRRDGYGHTASKWFARYRVRCGIGGRGKVFHSFRHTVADRLKQADVPGEKIAELVGHENSSITTGRYGKRYRPAALLETVKMLSFPVPLHRR
jgi:integrase